MKTQIYQAKGLMPRVDGKNGGSHCRFLFREDHSPQERYDTFEAYVSDEQLGHIVKQGLNVLPKELVDSILNELED